MPHRYALLLGAASRIGAAIMGSLERDGYTHAVLAERADRRAALEAITRGAGRTLENTTIVTMDPERPFAGLDDGLLRAIGEHPVVIFHLAQSRDRRAPADDIRRHNPLMLDRALSIAYKADRLISLVVVTDVGLVGDYPGLFSEGWIDVGQTPFDEVDRTSLEAELACADGQTIPILRARVGVVLDSVHAPEPYRYWSPPSEILLGAVSFIRRLPRFVTVPVAVARGALAPVTPADWAAEVLLALARKREAAGGAVHLVIDAPPSMDRFLEELSRKLGGARVRGGLPADVIARLGIVPGFRELARRNADQIAAWWTPHRYCLSRNHLDTARLRALLSDTLFSPSWASLRGTVR